MEAGRAWEGRRSPWLGEQERYRYISPSGEVIRKREIPTSSSGQCGVEREREGELEIYWPGGLTGPEAQSDQ